MEKTNGCQEDHKNKLKQKIEAIFLFFEHVSQSSMYTNTMLTLNKDNFYQIDTIYSGKTFVNSLVSITKGCFIFNNKEYIITFHIKDRLCLINGYDFKQLLERNEKNVVYFIENMLPYINDIAQRTMDDYKNFEIKMEDILKQQQKTGKQNFEEF